MKYRKRKRYGLGVQKDYWFPVYTAKQLFEKKVLLRKDKLKRILNDK